MYYGKAPNYSKLLVLNWLLVIVCVTLAGICVKFLIRSQTSAELRTPALPTPQVSTAETGSTSVGLPQARLVTSNQTTLEPRRITVEELSTTELFKAASPSVVHITTESVRRDLFNLDLTKIPTGSGTGFVWDKQGHVVTNYHVIQDADIAHVALADHASWPAKLVGAAPDKDLAVLKLEAPAEQLIPVRVGYSKDLEVGLKVFAIGNPFGLDQTLTTGIISALGREIESVTRRPIRDMIQTDAAINPGNSGGPLLDSQGNLIGVNTAIYSPSGAYAGIGFAIPIDTVRRVIPQLILHGKLTRPGLKIELAPDSLSARLRLSGVIILNIAPGSTAETAGLTPTRRSRSGEIFVGDAITAVDGKAIRSSDDLWLAFEDYKIGDAVNLSILHDGEPKNVKVELQAID